MAPEEQGQEATFDLQSELANSLTAASESEQQTVDTPAVDTQQLTDPAAAPSTTEQPREIGDNPVWAPIREALGDDAYGQIKQHLAKMTDDYHKHVTKVNGELETFSPYRDYLQMEGMSPDFLARSVNTGVRIMQDPAAVYRDLGAYLQENGLLEEAGGEEGIDFGGAEGEDPRYADLEARYADAQSRIEQMEARFSQAAQAAEVQHLTQEAEKKVTTQLSDLRTANPWIGNREAGLIIQRAQQILEQTGKMPDLAEAAQPFIEMRQAALSTPRRNDTAPRLPGSGGGAIPATGKPLSQNTREDDIDLLADALRSAQK